VTESILIFLYFFAHSFCGKSRVSNTKLVELLERLLLAISSIASALSDTMSSLKCSVFMIFSVNNPEPAPNSNMDAPLGSKSVNNSNVTFNISSFLLGSNPFLTLYSAALSGLLYDLILCSDKTSHHLSYIKIQFE